MTKVLHDFFLNILGMALNYQFGFDRSEEITNKPKASGHSKDMTALPKQ